jgi:hypothetical protein
MSIGRLQKAGRYLGEDVADAEHGHGQPQNAHVPVEILHDRRGHNRKIDPIKIADHGVHEDEDPDDPVGRNGPLFHSGCASQIVHGGAPSTLVFETFCLEKQPRI